MTEPTRRKPAAFRLDDPNVVVSDADESFARDAVQIRPELAPDNLPVPVETLPPVRRGFPWGVVFWASLSGLILLAMGLSATQLIESLYARNAELGYFGTSADGRGGTRAGRSSRAARFSGPQPARHDRDTACTGHRSA